MSSILSIPRHRLVVALVVLGVGLLGVGDTLASRGSSQALKNIMRLKLGHSQKILEAIVLVLCLQRFFTMDSTPYD